MRTLVLGAAIAACLAGSASAAGENHTAWLVLKSKTSTGHLVVDGAVWTCKVNVCRSVRVKPDAAAASCKALSAQLGEITGFGYRGQDMTAADLTACNTH